MLNLIKYEFADNINPEPKGLKYIIAKNGNFSIRENNLLKVTSKLTAGFSSLPELSEGIELKLPKIPFNLFNDMVAFFKAIYVKDKTESSLFLFWNSVKEEYFIWAPMQKNGGASSTYQRDEDPEFTQMCKDNTLCMMAHSHPWKGSNVSPSGIDNNDEKDILLYLVVGNVEATPNVYLSTCPDGTRKQLNFFDVFENPMMASLSTLPESVLEYVCKSLNQNDTKFVFEKFMNLAEAKVDQEWFGKCSKAYPNYTKYNSGTGTTVKSYTNYNEDDYWDDYLTHNQKSYKTVGKPKSSKKSKLSRISDLYTPDDLKTILTNLPKSMNWLIDSVAENEMFVDFLPDEVVM